VHSRNPAETRRKLEALVNETLPDAQAQALSVREQQARAMAEDTRIGQLIAITGALALLLAAVGIYALAAYTLRRREREIVLRKLHGAGAGAVARLLVKEFAGVLVAACVVVLPVAAWVTQLYLSGFVERAPVGPGSLWVLLAAVALLALVTAVAVARHLRAALALRPLQALRG
jgi:putative ABC transport system permease protein